MIDELLNNILSNLTEMSDPSTKATLPRVEDNRPGLTPLTFQSPPPITGETPKPISEQVPRVQKESKTTVSKKDRIKATNKERIKQNIRHKTTNEPESHSITKCNCDQNKESEHS